MFKELGPLLRQRTVVMILTRLEDDTIRVNVIPRKLNESENDASPLRLAWLVRRKNWTPNCLPRWSSLSEPISN